MASNPRIEDLRKRIEKDPGSRLFAQLAEELRKDGELEDAIRVAREGLKSHPNYPSARMTLGRALLDTGDWAAARTEFDLVLKGAPDNILASRYLAECLENLGQRDAAIVQYKATLAIAPGEKNVVARLHELEGTTPTVPPAAGRRAPDPTTQAVRAMTFLRPASTHAEPVPPAAAAASAPPATRVVVDPPAVPLPPVSVAPLPAAAPPPPIPLATVDGEMELETSGSASHPTPAPALPSASPMAPIPLVAVDEEFELERPYDSPTTAGRGAQAAKGPAAPAPAATPPGASAPAPGAAPPMAPLALGPESLEEEFQLEAPHEAPTTGWAASIRPLPDMEEAPRPMPPPTAAPSAAPSALISPTLGELYFNQGFTDKAIEVYRELSGREPGNERLSARLRELEKLQSALAGGGPSAAAAGPGASERVPSAGSAPADRRQAIERTIVRLEGLLSAIRKG